MNLGQKAQLYRALRKAVYEKATYAKQPQDHQVNQAILRCKIEEICKEADLSLYQNNTTLTQREIWRHLWTKVQYAGIRTGIASDSVKTLTPFFHDWTVLAHADWDVGGAQYNAFREKSGAFAGLTYNSKAAKLNTTIQAARLYDTVAVADPLSFVTGTVPLSDPWGVHEHLVGAGYRGDITALHLMMDLGFPVIKPDIVVVSLFLKLGWLHQAQPSLPADLSVADLSGKGKYGSQFIYNQKPLIYKTVVNIAMEIAAAVSKADLIADIGWASDNASRELDLFCVKFGQTLEDDWGLTNTVLLQAEKHKGGLFGFFGLPAPLVGPNAVVAQPNPGATTPILSSGGGVCAQDPVGDVVFDAKTGNASGVVKAVPPARSTSAIGATGEQAIVSSPMPTTTFQGFKIVPTRLRRAPK